MNRGTSRHRRAGAVALPLCGQSKRLTSARPNGTACRAGGTKPSAAIASSIGGRVCKTASSPHVMHESSGSQSSGPISGRSTVAEPLLEALVMVCSLRPHCELSFPWEPVPDHPDTGGRGKRTSCLCAAGASSPVGHRDVSRSRYAQESSIFPSRPFTQNVLAAPGSAPHSTPMRSPRRSANASVHGTQITPLISTEPCRSRA